jgi:hypothetical protein
VQRAAAVAVTTAAALVLVAPAAAHVTAAPSFVTSGQPETVSLVAPNEREAAMTAFSVTVPAGLSIVEAVLPGGGWDGVVEGDTATWSGGELAAGTTSSFSLVLEASGEPGSVTLEAVQLYPGGDRVPWPVVLTILPGADGSDGGSSSGAALLVAGIGLLFAAGFVVVLWLRRSRSRAS